MSQQVQLIVDLPESTEVIGTAVLCRTAEGHPMLVVASSMVGTPAERAARLPGIVGLLRTLCEDFLRNDLLETQGRVS